MAAALGRLSMLQLPLNYKNVTIRPMQESDLADDLHWNTVETEWGEWDAPWEEDEPFDMEKERKKLQATLANPPKVYSLAEIDTDKGRHIGELNHYHIDGDKNLKALGIVIPPLDARGKGYGKNAFILWLHYHFANSDAEEIYTQTWSGNYPMICMAKSIGFEEIGRIKGIRRVKNQRYDALTFSISKEYFYELYNDLP